MLKICEERRCSCVTDCTHRGIDFFFMKNETKYYDVAIGLEPNGIIFGDETNRKL